MSPDGSAFAILTNEPAQLTEVQLDLRLVEADQAATPNPIRVSSRTVDDLIFDATGGNLSSNNLICRGRN